MQFLLQQVLIGDKTDKNDEINYMLQPITNISGVKMDVR